jgi:hypothetical protein
MAIESSYVCESCGDVTTGDSCCTRCLHELQEAAHARPPISAVRAACVDAAARIRDRIATIVASRAYSLAAEFREGARASASLEASLSQLVSQAHEGAPRELLVEGLGQLLAGVEEWNSYSRAMLMRLELLARDAHARVYSPEDAPQGQAQATPVDAPQGQAAP